MIYMIALLLAGILLAFLETIIPSGGMLGFLAAVALLGSVILGFRHSGPTGWIVLLVVFICVPTFIILGLKILPRTLFGRKMLLMEPKEDFADAGGKTGISDENLIELKGETGITITQLRPSGIAEIDGQRYSVVAEGEIINRGCDIVVIKVEGNSIIVGRKNI